MKKQDRQQIRTESEYRRPEAVPAWGVIAICSFACVPSARFLASNPGENLSLARLTLIAGALAALGLFMTGLASLRSGELAGTAAFVFCVIMTYSFNYAVIRNHFNGSGPYTGVLVFVVVACVLVLAAIAAIRVRVLQQALPVVGFALLVLPVAQTVLNSPIRQSGGQLFKSVNRLEKPRPPGRLSRVPVFFLLFDSYVSPEGIKKLFGRNDQMVYHELESLGFSVRRNLLASYSFTEYSVPSTLNMSYWSEAPQTPAISFGEAVQGKSAVVKHFRELGYQYVRVNEKVDGMLTPCTDGEDECYVSGGDKFFSLPELRMLFETPLKPVIERLSAKAAAYPLSPREVMATVNKAESARPTFLYAHFMLPHGPQRVDGRCRKVGLGYRLVPGDGESALARRAYLEQVECANRTMLTLSRRLVSRNPNAIIVIQADHGSRMWPAPGEADLGRTPYTSRERLDRFGAFSAVRYPLRCRRQFRHAVAVVNTFRDIFACIEGRETRRLSYQAFFRKGDEFVPLVRDPSQKSR